MQKFIGAIFLSGIISTILFAIPTHAQVDSPDAQYAPINGLEMYYEIHGTGTPIILIHGGLGGTVEFAQLIPALAETRQVIAVELQGHGHTADIDRDLSYEVMADDIAALITYLEFEKADVLGFSLGGGVALRTAIQHPEVVNHLILVSTAFSTEGIRPEFREGMSAMSAETANMMLETPMYQFYASVAPNVDDWSSIVGKVSAVTQTEFDWSDELSTVTAKTLIIAGDADYIFPEHAVSLLTHLGANVAGDFVGVPATQLAILPATTHFSILYRSDLLLPLINPFLDTSTETE